MKISPVRTELFHASKETDERTDGYYKSRHLQFFQKHLKLKDWRNDAKTIWKRLRMRCQKGTKCKILLNNLFTFILKTLPCVIATMKYISVRRKIRSDSVKNFDSVKESRLTLGRSDASLRSKIFPSCFILNSPFLTPLTTGNKEICDSIILQLQDALKLTITFGFTT